MKNIFGRATDLIGKTPTDDEFRQFEQLLGESATVSPRTGRYYAFVASGITFELDETFRRISFHFPSPHRDRERPNYYVGDLPGEFSQDDSTETVQRKLAVYGCKFVGHEETYRLPYGRTLILRFDEDHRLMEASIV